MDPVLSAALAPGAAIVISLVTFVMTQRSAQYREERSAAKETVDILVAQNRALHNELVDLRKRVAQLEEKRNEWERERAELSARVLALTTELHLYQQKKGS